MRIIYQINKQTGIYEDLKAIFPSRYKQILSIAYCLILEGNNSLSHFLHWWKLHHHLFKQDIAS
ncbi:hypothetical protein HMI01_17740 [Halolactibacillus miurensis]|uniref:Uncharacterized protein n=1 Tax=Halolactibacillus miurensis TaxID=306541 RepID=A0ABQ0VUG3_9BACI|nr:hypothetical protein HMI01_17740 [Halolactibacillus miurensis]